MRKLVIIMAAGIMILSIFAMSSMAMVKDHLTMEEKTEAMSLKWYKQRVEIEKRGTIFKALDDRNGNKINDRLETPEIMESSKKVKLVIRLNFERDWNTYRYKIPDKAIEALRYAGLEDFDVLYYIETVIGYAPGYRIRDIAALPFVDIISPEPKIVAYLDTSKPAMHVDENTLASYGLAGLDGDGQVIAILDSGIYGDHEAFTNPDDGQKIIAWHDFVNQATQPYDDHGHGTHCASIAAGNPAQTTKYKGVAPKAKLIGLKVMDASGTGGSGIYYGMQWCIQYKNTYNINVASMSLGTMGQGDSTIDGAAADMVSAGIVVVAAAGNEGPNGQPPKQPMGSPARAPDVITVGACRDDGTLSDFSTWGVTDSAAYDAADPSQYSFGYTKPEVLAPGEQIYAANSMYNGQWTNMGGEAAYAPGANTPWIMSQGTSMACPHVAGLAALMLQANPNLSPADIKDAMKAHTKPGTGAGDGDVRRGWGLVYGAETLAAVGHPPQITSLTANGKTPDQGLEVDEDETITFTMSATDSDGTIVEYWWDFDASDGTTQHDATGQTVTHSFPEMGTYTVTGYAVDNDGLSAREQIQITVRNVPPTADAGEDMTVDMDEQVTLSATATDTPSDMATLKYEWDLNGDGVYGDKTGKDITFSWSEPGTYTVGLKVTDNDGASATDSITVTVNNVAPTAAIKLDSSMDPNDLKEDSPVKFDGSQSTDTPSDAPTLKYYWDFDDSDGVDWEHPDSTAMKPTHTYNRSGTYTVSLMVEDRHGAKSQVATMTVTIVDVPPVAKIAGVSDDTPMEMDTIYLDGSASTDTKSDLPTLNYTWDFDTSRDSDGDGTPDNDADAYGVRAEMTVMRDGEITIKLTVRDDDGEESTATYTINAENRPPTINTPLVYDMDGNPVSEVPQGTPVRFQASIDDVPEDLAIMKITWTLPDGTYTGWNFTYTPTKKGYIPVTIRAEDDHDAVEKTFEKLLFVKNAPPVIEKAPKDMVVNDGQSVTLSVEATDTEEDLELLTCTWDFGDGTSAQGFEVTHTFRGGGSTKVVRVVVSDGTDSVSYEFNVTVNSLPVPKIADFKNDVPVGTEVELDASGSIDSDGTIVEYWWDIDTKADSDGNGKPDDDADMTGAKIKVKIDKPGMHYIRLYVKDNNGAVAYKDIAINGKSTSPLGSGGTEIFTSPSAQNGGLYIYAAIIIIIVVIALVLVIRKRREAKRIAQMEKEFFRGNVDDNATAGDTNYDYTEGTQYDTYDTQGGNYGSYDQYQQYDYAQTSGEYQQYTQQQGYQQYQQPQQPPQQYQQQYQQGGNDDLWQL